MVDDLDRIRPCTISLATYMTKLNRVRIVMSHFAGRTESSIYGREDEIQILDDAVSSLSQGTGAVFVIHGEAGIGKSTLVEYLLGQAAKIDVGFGVGYGLAGPLSIPLEPWLEVFRSWRGSSHGPVSRTVRHMLDAAADGASGEDRVTTPREIVETVRAQAHLGPVLIILEDLQWADDATTSAVSKIARLCRTEAIMLVVTIRSESVSGARGLAAVMAQLTRDTNATVIRLDGLSHQAIEQLVSVAVQLDSSERTQLVTYLMSKTSGNPLLVRELLEGLHEQGILDPTPSGQTLEERLSSVRIPDKIIQVVDLRLRQLDSASQDAIRLAAMLGDRIDLDVLSEIAGLDPPSAVAVVEKATGAGLIEAGPHSGDIQFRHSLIRDAVMQSIVPARRRLVHRQIAVRLVAHDSSDPDAVAWHFEQAGDDRAADWLLKAAERAQRAYAWETAADRIRRAYDLVPETRLQTRAWYAYRIARLLRHANADSAYKWMTRASSLSAVGGPPVLRAVIRFDLGHLDVFRGDLEGGITSMYEGLQLLDRVESDQDAGVDLSDDWISDVLLPEGAEPARNFGAATTIGVDSRSGTLVQWLADAGRYDEVVEVGRPFVNRLDHDATYHPQLLSSLGDAWYGLGRAQAARGEPTEATKALERAASCYERIGHHMLVAFTRGAQLSEVILPYFPFDIKVREKLAFQAQEAIARAAGAVPEALASNVAELDNLLLTGKWTAARELAERFVSDESVIEPVREIAQTRLARLHRQLGNHEVVWRTIDELLPAGYETRLGTRGFSNVVYLLMLAADLAIESNDDDLTGKWLDCLERWVDWSSADRWRPELILLRSRHLVMQGKRAEADHEIESAIAMTRELGLPLIEAQALRSLAECRLESGAGRDHLDEPLDRAIAIARRARARFSELSSMLVYAKLLCARGAFERAEEISQDVEQGALELGAIRLIQSSRSISERLLQRRVGKPNQFGLSPRELDVLRLVAQGMTDAQVAEELYISYRTVTTHLTSIFNKLNVNSRVSATRIAIENDIL